MYSTIIGFTKLCWHPLTSVNAKGLTIAVCSDTTKTTITINFWNRILTKVPNVAFKIIYNSYKKTKQTTHNKETPISSINPHKTKAKQHIYYMYTSMYVFVLKFNKSVMYHHVYIFMLHCIKATMSNSRNSTHLRCFKMSVKLIIKI